MLVTTHVFMFRNKFDDSNISTHYHLVSLHRKCLSQLMYLCLEINLMIQTFPLATLTDV